MRLVKLIALLASSAICLAAQGVLSPSLLRQAGATDGQALCWSDANSRWQPCTVSGGGGGGGASALNDLTDVTITAAATGEVLRYNGSAWVDATLAFSDLSGSATDGQIPDTITASNYLPLAGGTMTGQLVAATGASLGVVIGDGDTGIREQSDDVFEILTNGATRFAVSVSVADVQVPLAFPDGTSSAPGLRFRSDTDNGLFRAGANNWGLAVGGTSFAELGGPQTLLVQNQTATTGDTTAVVKAGAAEAGNVFEVQNNAGSAVFGVDETGVIATSLTASRCVETDSSGNLTVAASTCGSGGGASALDDLTDVTITTVASGNLLRYNGSAWVNTTLGTGDLPSGATLDTEWDTIAEIETATSVNIIVSTEVDTLAELDTLVADVTLANLIYAASTLGTDNAIVRADGTSRNVQASSATIDDSGNISTAGSITAGSGGGGTGSIAGAAGSTTITGGTGAGDDLIFATTSNVTKGSYRFSELDCSGNANGGALTADASGNITCTDDDGSASLAFSALTSATNTAAAMVVGTGASLSVSGSGTIAATTAAALAANPADCSGGQFANAIAANGDLTCASPSGGAGDPNYTESFTSQTSVSMTNAEHGYGHANLLVQCHDNASPKALLVPNGVAINTSTYEVVVTFSTAQTGSCTVNGSGTTVTETNALETDGAAGIADTEVFIGTGAGTGNYAVLSGDATMANTGVVTLSAAITRDAEWDTAAEINAATTDDDFVTLTGAQTLSTGTKTLTAKLDAGGGTVEIPNSTTLPGTCAVGDMYMDTDATSGQRLYLCESANTWALQGDGGGAETNSLEADGAVGIADTEIYIGTGAGTGNYAVVSGDATLANTGALSLVAGITRDTEWDTAAEINAATTDDDFVTLTGAETIATGTKTVTAKFDFGGGTLEVPNSTTLPATCSVGDFYMDTDATSGQRMYACESTNTWVQQGGGAETNALEGDGASGIANTEIFIGTGAGTGNYAAVSGDATLANTGALTIAADAVTLAKLNDGANTPTLNDFVVVDTGATGVKYVTPNAGTDITADLEEEAHASEHQHGGGDEVATATAGANAIPKAGAGGTLADGWIAQSNVTQHQAALSIAGSQLSDQNAGTNITADLEEETHASEHAENAADELLVENLGTACANGEVVKADATGGLVCGTDNTGGASGTPNYTESFSAQTSVSMTNAEHGFGHANLIVECYDNASPKAKLEPNTVTVNTSTYEVIATFSTAQTGSCTVNGSGTIAAFNAITGGTNTTAAMVVGTGASLSASGSGSITATAVAADSVALTTGTTGNYVASVATTAPITGGAAGSEGATLTIALNQNAGTDVTADLEEETHASEHSLGGGDAITATNLASACTDAQVLGGTVGGTGVECQTDDDVPESGDFGAATDLDADGSVSANSVALGTDTTGNYAAGDAEGGAALTGDSATAFFSAGTIEQARLPAAWDVKTLSLALDSPVTGDSGTIQWEAPTAVTVTQVDCSTDTGTATIQIDERTLTTPNTGGTDVMSSTLVCDTNNQQTTAFANAGIAAGALINLDVDAVASSPTKLRIHIRYTID